MSLGSVSLSLVLSAFAFQHSWAYAEEKVSKTSPVLESKYIARDGLLRMDRPRGGTWARTISGTPGIFDHFRGTLVPLEEGTCIISRDQGVPVFQVAGVVRNMLGASFDYRLNPYLGKALPAKTVVEKGAQLIQMREKLLKSKELGPHPCRKADEYRGDYVISLHLSQDEEATQESKAAEAKVDSIAGEFAVDETGTLCIRLDYDLDERAQIAAAVKQLCGSWFGLRFAAALEATPLE
jgi:hypothetical protein